MHTLAKRPLDAPRVAELHAWIASAGAEAVYRACACSRDTLGRALLMQGLNPATRRAIERALDERSAPQPAAAGAT